MRREMLTPRRDWREKCDVIGFRFHSQDGVYWDESACYRFDAGEIDDLEAAAAELHALCLDTVDRAVRAGSFARFAIPEPFVPYVAKSWLDHEASLFGRFDLRYDGSGPPKLLEYNADTPTSLIEAAVAQWQWLTEVRPGADQFNSLHEKLIARWTALRAGMAVAPVVHFSCVRDSIEDLCNLEYLMDTALQAGIDSRLLFVEDIGWNKDSGFFVDLDDRPLSWLCKLYPWEWMMREEFGANLPRSLLRTVEPPWKTLLSNKALLPLLWEDHPGHPNLLPAYFEDGRIEGPSVKKPLFAREGANITIRRAEGRVDSENRGYGAEGHVFQAFEPLPDIGGGHVVIGAWLIGDEPAGIGIREDVSLITSNTSRFVPHYFE